MISRADIESVRAREDRPDSPVLSVYLDTDQSKAVNVNRSFTVVLRNLLRELEQSLDLDKDGRREFQNDIERVFSFVDEYREPKRGLVVFSDASEDFFWVGELQVSVRNGVWRSESPHLRPLLELFDEHERYGVVLADREHARLFTIFLDEVEEHLEAFAPAEVKHIKSPGTDHLMSQMKVQRKADEHAHLHIKHVAELVSRLAGAHEFDRLILAGQTETISELHGLLPKLLQSQVVGKAALPVDANVADVLETTTRIEEKVERAREADLIERLITGARKNQKAVLGLDATLLALQEGRIRQLIYMDGFTARGSQCTNCQALLADTNPACNYCGKPVRTIDDLIETAAGRVIDSQGKVEQVRGTASERLQKVGSIGASLRY